MKMDRLTQLRGEAGGARDSTLDSSAASEAYITANETSNFFSISEDSSSFEISPIKDVSLASTADPDKSTAGNDELVSNLSPIPKKGDLLDSFKIGKQIEAANILSGGVNIFDDNDNSYDGDGLIIDDNVVEIDEKSSSELKLENTGLPFSKAEEISEGLVENEAIASKDTEVVLQIDGKNVNAIDIGNGLYLYRKEGEEELAAVQIIDDDQQQPSFKFLKVRENAEGNLEVYEEIEIEVPKEVPTKEGKTVDKNVSHVPIKDISKVISDPICNKVAERKNISPQKESLPSTSTQDSATDSDKDSQGDKNEINLNGKMVKFNETRKSPVIHSTPNKEGIPLTKTMVDLHLHPSRHSDNVKTIEVHTDIKHKLDIPSKDKDVAEDNKSPESISIDKDKEDIKTKHKDIVEDKDDGVSDPVKLLIGTEENKSSESVKLDENTEKENKASELVKIYEKPEKETTGLVKSDEKFDKEKKMSEIVKPGENTPQEPEVTTSCEKLGNQTDENRDVKKEKKNEDKLPKGPIESENVVKELEEKLPKRSLENKEIIIEQEKKTIDKLVKQTIENKNVENEQDLDPVVLKDKTSVPEGQNKNNVLSERSKTVSKNDSLDITQPLVENPQKDDNTVSDNSKKMEITEVKHTIRNPEASKSNEATISDVNKVQDPQSTEIVSKPTAGAQKEVPNIINLSSVDGTVKMDIIKTDKVSEPVLKTAVTKPIIKKEITKVAIQVDKKPINNNHNAVPFGKWTEANRQEFLNKIKESKIQTNSTNTKQIKNSNDLNRRDVLQKIDSQRQTSNATAQAKIQEVSNKLNVKNETKTFTSKPATAKQESKIPVKTEVAVVKNKPAENKKATKQETKLAKDFPNTTFSSAKKEPPQRKEINNQDLIDKTIEDIINRAPAKLTQEDTKQIVVDDIEKKMNELHGIPFVERPLHELPQINRLDVKSYTKQENPKVDKVNKIPNLDPYANKTISNVTKQNVVEIDSEEEIIEHEPITGDIELTKKECSPKMPIKSSVTETIVTQVSSEGSKKEAIITENDFDKFARRNSITYENCLTVNFEGNQPHNVIQTVVEKDVPVKKYTRNEILLAEAKVKSSHKHLTMRQNKHPSKIQITSKLMPVNEDAFNKSYCHSKLQKAYQSALTAKRKMESPITIIEDKPVKVVFMDSPSEFLPSQLNVQGNQLSPSKKQITEPDVSVICNNDSVDSDMLDAIDDGKSPDETKSKIKHQRKQVLTPVETPDLELIEPSDLETGVEFSPKKKRKTEDSKSERSSRNVVPKKSYLLRRSPVVDDVETPQDLTRNPIKDTINLNNSVVSHTDAASAIDNLVKAAELLETQSENLNISSNTDNLSSQQATPVKRGRGRPRKYPLPEGAQLLESAKIPSPQKKPRLIDAKKPKIDTVTDDDETTDDEIVKENWTMGKINENIVCPICNKLFRSENVIFKHVRHCSSQSPSRSDSDKRSPRRSRYSLESKSKSVESDVESEKNSIKKDSPKKRKSKELSTDKDIVVIEHSPVTEDIQRGEPKEHISRRAATKAKHRSTNLECEVCGKTFRQLSYLMNHKLQHKKVEAKKTDPEILDKSVFSCDVCKKEFRKLHHLVQHRIIHNSTSSPSKQNEDQSAAFRCEPCDKSFRKLHHLVEHRETHDGINRQKNNPTVPTNVDKAPLVTDTPQCDVCKKTFRKLHHLSEHKEQHLETSSEKSDDKSVKSSLSTRDIIHECSLCYMVFPNEHSLNKHTGICQKKKRQSAAKQAKQRDENEKIDESTEFPHTNDTKVELGPPSVVDKKEPEKSELPKQVSVSRKPEEVANVTDTKPLAEKRQSKEVEIKPVEPKTLANKQDATEAVFDNSIAKADEIVHEIPVKIKRLEEKSKEITIIEIEDTPKKKVAGRDKLTQTVTKRKKPNLPISIIDETAIVESSDDEEIRYMLNPDFNHDKTAETKFMNVRANKRSSLQIERPNSKDLVTRRISLQHPPKVPRLKAKPVETRVPSTSGVKTITRTPKLLRTSALDVPSTDSDDGEVKYSFPKTAVEKSSKPPQEVKSKEAVKTVKEKRNSLAVKRKSLVGLAKRKTMGQIVTGKHKVVPPPVKPVKRRTAEVEHRCDCGQLFSSAALLTRHTTLAHTPPRIRRRRSPPPDVRTKAKPKPTLRKPTANDKKDKNTDRKTDTSKPSKKSDADPPKTPTTRKSLKAVDAAKSTKVSTRKSAAHRGVPVPDKMRKIMDKLK